MVKKVLIIPSVAGLIETLDKMCSEFSFIRGELRKLRIHIQNSNIEIIHDKTDIRSFWAVWLSSFWDTRDLAYAISTYLDHFNVSHTFVEQTTSKVSDQVIFTLNSILTPSTVYAYNSEITGFIDDIEKICGYPLIIKDIKGSRGNYSAYVDNRKDFLRISASLPKHRKYLYQSFIKTDYDWGILVANGKVVSAEKSYPCDKEFRNNACNGAHEVFVDLAKIPKAVKDIAIKASNTLNLNWSRADIIIDKETQIPYLLEVNRCPGITANSSEAKGAQIFAKEYLNLL
jgi:glutathione synthase/RimK-type ligase-like ATP-grasp enzyme